MEDGGIADYKYISGFTEDNFISLTELDTVRENASFLLLGFDSDTDYQIFSVGTFSGEELENLRQCKDKQDYIVTVRSRSLYDVDIAVKDSDKILALVQKSGQDRYVVAFAVKGSRNIFPSVDIKTMAVYSDWFMEERGLTDEFYGDAILYAQEVYDRDNRLLTPVRVEYPSSDTYSSSGLHSSSVLAHSSSNAQSSSSVKSSSATQSSSTNTSPSSKAQSSSANTVPSSQTQSAVTSQAETFYPSPSSIPAVTPPLNNTPRPAETPAPSAEPAPQPTPAEEILTVTMNGQVVSGPASQILSQIVAIEMSSSWNREALKAQAVATHTYLEYQYSNGVAAPSVSGRTSPNQKVIDAVSQVSDLVMTVGGRAVYTPYTASVAGRTNPASQVWGTAHSHLVSVESKYDCMTSGYEKVYTIPAQEMKEILDSRIGTNLDLENAENWFEIVDYTDGGYVRRMSVDGVRTYTAASGNTRNITGWYFASDILRDAGRPLRSAAFTIAYSDGNFIIVTQGYGHGVGLSQWGAQMYASQEGWAYDQILTHYYTGVSIQKWK